MASYETDEERKIRDRFEDKWLEETPVQYPNSPFTKPSDRSEYARLNVLTDDGQLADVAPSNARHRFIGQVVVQVFVPRGIGSKRSNELCQKAIDAFNHYSDGDLIFGTAFKRTVGEDASGYYQQNVIAPYTRDSLISIA